MNYLRSVIKGNHYKSQIDSIIQTKILNKKGKSNFNNEMRKQLMGVSYSEMMSSTKNFSDQIRNEKIFPILKNSLETLRNGNVPKNNDLNMLNEMNEGITANKNINFQDKILLNSILFYGNHFGLKLINSKKNIENNFKLLEENSISEFDQLSISNRLNKILYDFYSADNFYDIKNRIFEEIACSTLINEQDLVLKGLCFLETTYQLTLQSQEAENCKNLIFKLADKKMKNKFLYNNLISNHSKNWNDHPYPILAEINSVLLNFDLKDNVHNYQVYKYLNHIQKLIKELEEFEPSHPLFISLYCKLIVLMTITGRERNANYYTNEARNFISKHHKNDPFVIAIYHLKMGSDFMASGSFEIADDYFNKNGNLLNKYPFTLVFKKITRIVYSINQSKNENIIDSTLDYIQFHKKYFNCPDNDLVKILTNLLKSVTDKECLKIIKDKMEIIKNNKYS